MMIRRYDVLYFNINIYIFTFLLRQENDPGPVEGTDLLILKYPHPKVILHTYNVFIMIILLHKYLLILY